MFVGVSKLEPGSYVTWDGNSLTSSVYYRPSHTPPFTERAIPELSSDIREHLHTSVRRGVPWSDSWSAFLSGGLDSSGVVYSLGPAPTNRFLHITALLATLLDTWCCQTRAALRRR